LQALAKEKPEKQKQIIEEVKQGKAKHNGTFKGNQFCSNDIMSSEQPTFTQEKTVTAITAF